MFSTQSVFFLNFWFFNQKFFFSFPVQSGLSKVMCVIHQTENRKINLNRKNVNHYTLFPPNGSRSWNPLLALDATPNIRSKSHQDELWLKRDLPVSKPVLSWLIHPRNKPIQRLTFDRVFAKCFKFFTLGKLLHLEWDDKRYF